MISYQSGNLIPGDFLYKYFKTEIDCF